jgi:hypothetical protein
MPLVPQFQTEKPTELDACEQLLLRSFRRWTLGLTRSDALALEATWNDLASTLGPESARSTLDALSSFVFRLAGTAKRIIRHHHPCCPRLTWDEWCLLGLVSACQRGKLEAAVRAASGLAGTAAVGPILEGATGLAEALRGAGRALPDRSGAASVPIAAFGHLERGTIH